MKVHPTPKEVREKLFIGALKKKKEKKKEKDNQYKLKKAMPITYRHWPKYALCCLMSTQTVSPSESPTSQLGILHYTAALGDLFIITHNE